MSYSVPTVLTIAGSDSSGGAGVQADLKTIESFGLFGQSAITSLTAQNTLGVNAVFDASPEFVEAQIDAVFDDMVPDAVKIGMISSSAIAEAVARALRRRDARHIVVDPVMVATSGADLMRDGAVRAVVGDLFPLAEVITPNLSEARALCGFDIVDAAGMERAARMLAGMTSGAVLVKGGHLDESADDCLVFDGRTCWLRGTRVDTGNTHGTGCTLSSAIACGLASGKSAIDSVRVAKAYVAGALSSGFSMGKGSGPLDHMWRLREALASL
ncbi:MULTISPECIES: bifunctional hydroxymethylpyrimidine kinase/phosphomethylpyrimidine kinase [Slackia]|uniref:bifunctional hydroxymethylpyrimidine kinase/phosphomethylpyrimidine kinase n=1 Tax=Slackia TaxID=84108 RepID=UPI00027C51EF|nr:MULTISPECIES: bifunctional hydroxymethylpyrimidine kinase/phosphomethylpyrimidine kinase [Slackia]EJU32182.1 phosphomethylpyrimidine kinase [Slackia sp. CM382]MCK6139829.1 bifunctional hydroxymethylpyrimidine kinase/phosphomethylpyrimidine kinase [Slackia exigua]